MIIVMHLHFVTARLPPFAMSLTATLLLEIYALLRIENLDVYWRNVRSIGSRIPSIGT